MATRGLLLVFGLLTACGASREGGSTGGGQSGSGGAGSGASGGGGGDGGSCPSCDAPTAQPAPTSPEIVEASGLAASALHAGVLYVHNDSGDTARFFAIGADGSDQGTFALSGVTATDWEDAARGPCASTSKSCLYFGDIGDNEEVRQELVIHRVEEPAQLGPGPHTLAAESFRFRYPDGPHDAEALLVHPTTGDVTIVTKGGPATLAFELQAPLDGSRVVTATLVGEVPVPSVIPLVTGGDVRPDATAALLRTYTGVLLFPIAPGQRVGEALTGAACSLDPPLERQGEAIAWASDGSAWLTLGEGTGQPMWKASCR